MTYFHSDAAESAALTSGWRLLSTAPDAIATPASLPDSAGWVSALVPGTVAGSRREAGTWNPEDPPDLHAEDHWYRLDAHLPPHARLQFRGLATLAEVWLDGLRVACSESMFQPLEVPVPPQGAARIDLCFRALRPRLAAGRRGGRTRWLSRFATSEALRQIRTTLLGHLPGCFPPIGVVGPYRPILLRRSPDTGPVVERSSLRASVSDAVGRLDVRLAGRRLAGVPATLRAAGGVAAFRPDGDGIAATLLLPQPPLWWPHTHGEPTTIAVQAEIDGVVLDLGRTGFRSVVRRGADGFGLVVNDVPVFCRGAIWSGVDLAALPTERAALLPLLRRACQAGMNMLRVPGFALYEAPAFLEACAELGIMVWQDFMFARFDYPQDAGFLAAAQAEARAFLEAAQASPALVVLCGGSEVEQSAAMAGRPVAEWRAPLFDAVLAGEAAAVRPDVVYLRNAPHGSPLPFAADAAVTHYFGVGGYLRPPEDLRAAGVNFAAECLAFANPPDPAGCRALAAATRDHRHRRQAVVRDFGAEWDFEDVRDHYVATLFGVDPVRLRREEPDRWLAYGRAAVALLIEETFGVWRTDGRCAGGLVLMLKDLGPGMGWGVISHDMRPKSAWHAMRRAFRPIQVVLRNDGLNGLAVCLVNDTATGRRVRLRLRGLTPEGGAEALGEAAFDLLPQATRTVPAVAITGRWRDLGHAWRFGPAPFAVLGATLEDAATGSRLAEATIFPGGAAQHRNDVGLMVALRHESDQCYLNVTTRGFAQFVQVDDNGFIAEDDHFHLWPGETREVALTAAGGRAPQGMVTALNSHAAAYFGNSA